MKSENVRSKNLFKSRGLTILEVILATTIFSLLSSLIFYIFAVSSQSWLKTRQTVEVKESAQVVFTRIEKELRSSAYSSVEIIEFPDPNNNAISFLSGQNSTGKTTFDEKGKIKWKKFIIFYLEDDPKVLRDGYYQLLSKEVSLGEFTDDFATESIEFLVYPPLKIYEDDESKFKEMIDYMDDITLTPRTYISSPRPVSRNIRALNFKLGARDVEIYIKTGKPVNPRDSSSEEHPEKVEITGNVVLRNI